jgi:hypothetical protein
MLAVAVAGTRGGGVLKKTARGASVTVRSSTAYQQLLQVLHIDITEIKRYILSKDTYYLTTYEMR